MNTLRRTIHPQIRILDEKKGIAEFVASDETIDSYNEVIRAAGWQFNRAQKNFPFVDSHDYSTIEKCLGQVVDYGVVNRRLMNTVQYALDVPEARLAQFAWKMLVAKMLPAVSVGFIPVQAVTKWDSDQSDYQEQLEQLNLGSDADIRCIYIVQEQIELSQCVIGANPNAVAQIEKAYRAGVLSDSDISGVSKIVPDFAVAFEKRNHRPRSYSFGSAPKTDPVSEMMTALGGKKSTSLPVSSTMKKPDFLKDFTRMAGENKSAFTELEARRVGGNESELQHAVRHSFLALKREQRLAGDPVDQYLAANPEQRYLWNALGRKFLGGGIKVGSLEEEVLKSVTPGLAPGDAFGSFMFPITISPDIFDLLLIYGAFKDLGVTRMLGQYTKFVVVTGLPSVLVLPAEDQGEVQIPPDANLSGLNLGGPNVAQPCSTFISLVVASRELMNDQRVDLAATLMRLFIQALAGSIDYCSFSANGAADVTNAYMTGIFLDQNIKSYQANVGKESIPMLSRADFINTIGAVTPAALQRPCRWYINPAFIPNLLTLKDGPGDSWLLKTPADTGGEWHLVGFPVTWAAAAPAQQIAGSKIAAFGEPNSYCVGIRELFELMNSQGLGFSSNTLQMRAIARGRCVTRQADGFATLQLSA